MSFRFKGGVLPAGLFVSALGALLTIATPALGQSTPPSVLAFGARLAFPGITTPSKVSRDAAGNVFVLVPGTPAIWEIPVNGPIQIVVPSTDASFGQSLTGTPGKPNAFQFTADPAGNLYIVQVYYSYTEVTYEIPRNANGSYGTSTIVATGIYGPVTGNNFNNTTDIAVDSAHNIYYGTHYGIASINSSIANPVGVGGRYVLGAQGTTPTNYPRSVTVDAGGNLFYVDTANAWEIPATMAQGSQPATPTQIGTPTCTSCAALTALATPNYIFLDPAGDIFIGNASAYTYLIPNTGSAFSSNSVTYALPNGVVKSSYTYGAVANNGDLYLDYGGSLELYGAGKFYIGSPAVGSTLTTGAASSTSYASPSAAFYFTQPVTLGSVGTPAYPYAVLNYGSANAGAGPAQISLNGTSGSSTCVAGTTYAAGASCTVELGYYAHDPGSFTGSLALYGCPSTSGTCNAGYTSGSVLASVNGTSLATGSALTIDTGYTTTIGSGYLAPAGLVVDNAGNTYVADPGSNSVLKYAPGSSVAGTTVGTGLSEPSGVALDAGGNLYIADTGNDRIVVISVAGTQSVLSTGTYAISSPHGIAVDSFGNIFIADTGFQRVLEVPNPFSTAISFTPTVIAGSPSTPTALIAPYGIALDPYNNLIIADKGANAVYEIPTSMLTSNTTAPASTSAAIGSGTLTSIGSGFSSPTGVAADGSGSVYVVDSGNKRIVKIPSLLGIVTSASQSVLFSGLNSPFGIATDLTADLFFTDQGAPRVALAKRSAPSGSNATTDAFGAVATSSTGSQAVTASNAGLTTALTLTSIGSPATPFSQASTTCGSSLTAGSSCTVSLQYAPTAAGASTGSFTVTDNALAVTTATQIVSLTGVGSGTVASATMTGVTSAIYGDDVSFTVTAKDSTGNVAIAANGPYAVSISGTASSSASVTLNNGVGTFFLPTAGLGVGSYNLSATVGTFPATASLTISKAPLYVTAADFTRSFDVANPALSYTYSGFVNGDTASVVTGSLAILTTASRTSPAGYFPVTLSGSPSAANYSVSLINGDGLVLGNAPQTILFPPLPGFTHGTSVTLTGTSTSGLPLTYEVYGGTISGSVLTIGAAGAVTVTATQSGNGSYAAATPIVRTFTAQ